MDFVPSPETFVASGWLLAVFADRVEAVVLTDEVSLAVSDAREEPRRADAAALDPVRLGFCRTSSSWLGGSLDAAPEGRRFPLPRPRPEPRIFRSQR